METGLSHRPICCPIALIPWASRLALGLFATALVLGHLNPPEPLVEARFAGPARPVIVKGGEVWRPNVGGLWIDPRTGNSSTLPLPSSGLFSNAVIAPWQDRNGGTRALGCWVSRGTGELPVGSYLARFALPGGTLVDAVEITSILDGPPCWFPGEPDRILFAEQDGELYEFALRSEGCPRLETRPHRLSWRVDRPLGEGSRIHAPSWSSDERLGGRILASVEPQVIGPRGPDFQQLWWLQLDETGTTVDAAGPLGPGGSAHDDRGEGRFPVAATNRDGDLVLAYLFKPKGEPGYEVRVAPIETDPMTGVPTVRIGSARVLAGRCHPTPPIFAADGSSIFAVSAESTRLDLLRFPLADDAKPLPDHHSELPHEPGS